MFPTSHPTAFVNDLIGKLFSKAVVNYSISSILQPLKETVQSPGACLHLEDQPQPRYGSDTEEASGISSALVGYQCDANF
jgi:hypothetical protein